MADDQNQDQTPAADSAAAVARPEYIPETIWDGEKNAPKIDIAAALTERDTLSAAATERAAKIPAKPEDYKFDLPSDFQMPEGLKWEASDKDPMVSALRTYATENKMTQQEVSGLVKIYALKQAEDVKAQRAFDAEQTKQLGEKAGARREAAKQWLGSTVTPAQAQVLGTLLDYKDGVEALESIIAKAGGVNSRGTPGGSEVNKNANHVEIAGTQGGGRKLLEIANAKKP